MGTKRKMITPEGVRKMAFGWYRKVLVAGFTKEEFFPKNVRFGKVTKNQIYYNRERKVQETETLNKGSRSVIGYGYTLVLVKKYTHKYGYTTVPARIYFENLDEYLKYTSKRNEYFQFLEDAGFIKSRYPELESWIERYPKKVIKFSGEWSDILKVCDYFVENPEPDVFLDDLPIGVPEKFVRKHKAIIGRLLDQLIPEYVQMEESVFEKRYNLKVKDPYEWYLLHDRELYDKIMGRQKETDIKPQ